MAEASQRLTKKVYFWLTLLAHCGSTEVLPHIIFTLAPGQGEVSLWSVTGLEVGGEGGWRQVHCLPTWPWIGQGFSGFSLDALYLLAFGPTLQGPPTVVAVLVFQAVRQLQLCLALYLGADSSGCGVCAQTEPSVPITASLESGETTLKNKWWGLGSWVCITPSGHPALLLGLWKTQSLFLKCRVFKDVDLNAGCSWGAHLVHPSCQGALASAGEALWGGQN